MRGLEYLTEREERPNGKSKKASNKEPVKKSNHKHDYKEVKVIKDNFAHFDWEKVFYECGVCGKNKEESRTVNP